MPRAALDEVRLRHDLDGVLLVRVERRDLVNLREPTLPKELPPQVGVDGVPVTARALAVLDDRDRLPGAAAVVRRRRRGRGAVLLRRDRRRDGDVGVPLLVLTADRPRRRQRLLPRRRRRRRRRRLVVVAASSAARRRCRRAIDDTPQRLARQAVEGFVPLRGPPAAAVASAVGRRLARHGRERGGGRLAIEGRLDDGLGILPRQRDDRRLDDDRRGGGRRRLRLQAGGLVLDAVDVALTERDPAPRAGAIHRGRVGRADVSAS